MAELPPTGPGPGRRRATVALAAALAAAAVLAACGDEPAKKLPDEGVTTSVPSATSAPAAGRTYTADLTTADGYRYTISVRVGPRSPTGPVDACPGPATAGLSYVPVTLTVANAATDRSAPFPPLRIEMTMGAGTSPGQVVVRDAAGACTFTPRAPSLGPGTSAVFQGTSPAIDDSLRGGSAGQIEVKVSENTFSLAAPLP